PAPGSPPYGRGLTCPTTIPGRRSMTKNGTPNTAGSSQNRYALGARGKAVWRTDRTRYSRAMSWAPGGTGGGGGRRRTYSCAPKRSRKGRLAYPPVNWLIVQAPAGGGKRGR